MLNEQQLKTELERAYRCIQGMHNALGRGSVTFPAEAYHALTIGAAKRFVFEGALDGSEYFIGKHATVLHDALNLPRVVETKTYADGTTATGTAPLPDESPNT